MKMVMSIDGRQSIHHITYHYVFNGCRIEIYLKWNSLGIQHAAENMIYDYRIWILRNGNGLWDEMPEQTKTDLIEAMKGAQIESKPSSRYSPFNRELICLYGLSEMCVTDTHSISVSLYKLQPAGQPMGNFVCCNQCKGPCLLLHGFISTDLYIQQIRHLSKQI